MRSDKQSAPGFALSPVAGVDPVIAPDDPIIGRWRADRSRQDLAHHAGADGPLKRYGVGAPPEKAALGAWAFTAEGQGVRLQQFGGEGDGPSDAAAIDFFSTWDGRPWADPYGPSFLGQLVQHWRLGPHLVVRLVLDNVSPPERLEWMTYAVSTDGGTLATTSWRPGAPGSRDVQAFIRQGEAVGSPAAPRDGLAKTVGQRAPAAAFPTDPILGRWVSDAAELRFETNGDALIEASSRSADPLTYWKIDRHLLVRRSTAADARVNWSVYVIAADGATMGLTRWDEASPDRQDVELFRKDGHL